VLEEMSEMFTCRNFITKTPLLATTVVRLNPIASPQGHGMMNFNLICSYYQTTAKFPAPILHESQIKGDPISSLSKHPEESTPACSMNSTHISNNIKGPDLIPVQCSVSFGNVDYEAKELLRRGLAKKFSKL
jgi:hypothetical protein